MKLPGKLHWRQQFTPPSGKFNVVVVNRLGIPNRVLGTHETFSPATTSAGRYTAMVDGSSAVVVNDKGDVVWPTT